MKKSALNVFQIASFVAGVALFAYLIKQTGLTTLTQYVAMMGWGALLILGLSAVRNCARAGSWYFSIEPGQRGVSFWSLMNVMLAGEAIKYMTATGPLVSEPAKAAMVRKYVPLLQGFSSVVVENLIYYLTVFIFMFASLPALAWLAEVPGDVKLAGYILMSAIAFSILITWVAIRRRWYVLARALEQLARITARRRGEIPAQPRRIDSMGAQVRRVEENLYTFYERRRGAFYLIFSLNMASHFINVVEVCLILALMKLPATILNGCMIEAVTKVINLIFFFVPTRAGVYESGNALMLQALGMSAAAGVALAIIRKLRAFVWVAYGLGVIGVMMLNKEGELKIEN